MMSPKLEGRTAASVRRMPSDSSWNTPTVSPRWSSRIDILIVPFERIKIGRITFASAQGHQVAAPSEALRAS
jgi:hypothetical protein